jgi:DNA processing protein
VGRSRFSDLVRLIALLETPGIGRKTARRALFPPKDSALRLAEKILLECRSKKVRVLSIEDELFPEALKNISDPPLVIYAQGNISALKAPALAVVGTRVPKEESRARAFRYAEILAEKKIGVVSGLALGIDTAAHEGCLAKKGRTVAVLPSGFDRLYPPANKALAAAILKKDGCLLSEYPPHTGPEPFRFVERDRIQSGLSAGVVVVETEAQGGAMHTARFCRQEERPLGACPASPALLRWESVTPILSDADFRRFAQAASKRSFRPARGLLQ